MVDLKSLTAVISNSHGSIGLDGLANGSEDFHITKFEGFESSDIQINKTDYAVGNGSLISSVRLQSRTITIEAAFNQRNGANEKEVEQFLIGFFDPFQTTRITVNKYGYKRYLDFVVSSFKTNFENSNKKLCFQLVGDAPDPLLKDAEEFSEDVATKIPMLRSPFYFTSSGSVAAIMEFKSVFTLDNTGHIETGIDLIIKASGEVVNPKLTNLDTGQYLKINKTLASGDVLEISTVRSNNYVRINGVNESKYKDRGSTYFQLVPGSNSLTFSADSGYTQMSVYPKFRAEYFGI